jgi:hypothetical protein
MLLHASVHTSLLVHEFLVKHKTIVIPKLSPFRIWAPQTLSPPPQFEICSERSPFSDNKRDGSKFTMDTMYSTAKRIPGLIPEPEEMLEAVYRQWKGVL